MEGHDFTTTSMKCEQLVLITKDVMTKRWRMINKMQGQLRKIQDSKGEVKYIKLVKEDRTEEELVFCAVSYQPEIKLLFQV